MSDSPTFEELVERNDARVVELEQLGDRRRGAEDKELVIRAAIARFARGATTKTDGSWTVVNLVEESGVPRPTLYRYDREVQEFQNLAAAAPAGIGGHREELKRLRAELAAERKASREERKRHQDVEDTLIERIYALSLALASAAGVNGVPTLIELKRGRTRTNG